MNSLLKSLDTRQIQLAGYGGLALLLVVLLTYVLAPEWRAYQASQSSLEILRKNTANGSSLDAQLEALRDDVAKLERTLNGDASNLPAKQMEAFVLGRLQTLSWRHNITLVSVLPREGVPLNQFRELIFDVKLRGSYFDFFRWLQGINEEMGYVVVKQFDIANDRRGKTETDGLLQIELTMAAYRNQGS